MELYSQQLITKPQGFDEYSFIVMVGIYDQPTNPTSPSRMVYKMYELAINVTQGLKQVFVEAPEQSGLDKFLEDYPNSVVQSDSTLNNPKEWSILVYPNEEMPDESTPLDNLFQGRSRDIIDNKLYGTDENNES
ncbi:hypothetical protein BH09PAT1_BH09PAT1_1360 [soil metagenome]